MSRRAKNRRQLPKSSATSAMQDSLFTTDAQGASSQLRMVRALCLKALRDYRAYRKIHPEAFQVWACSERKGAAKLARRISRLLKRPNDQAQRLPPGEGKRYG